MKASRKEFIKRAHESACSDWKKEIENEFPKLFKSNELEVGKWYKKHDWIACFLKYGTNNYGFLNKEWCPVICIISSDWELATDREVEEALIKEAKKRGLWNNKNCSFFGFEYKDSHMTYREGMGISTLWSKYGEIFKNGKWTEILPNTITKEEAEKQLGKTILD